MVNPFFRRVIPGAVWVIGVFLALVSPGPGGTRAQSDWTAPYRPAMRPEFAGTMAAYASAPRYTIAADLTVTPEQAALAGHQAVVYTNRTTVALDQIVFRLYPNLESYGGAMEVNHITAGGTPVEPALDETRTILTVPLPQPLGPGQNVTLEMDFSVSVQAGSEPLYGQFSDLDGILSLPEAYPVLSVYTPGEGWWTVTAHPEGDIVFSETGFYTVAITAPEHLILAASGSEVDLVTNADGTLTHHYVAPLMRDFALFASESYVTLIGEQDGITVTLFYDSRQAGAYDSARTGLKMTKDALSVYNVAFGPYPFAALDVVETPTTAKGMEYPGLFVVGSDVWDSGSDLLEFIITHEAAHEWFYSLVGSDQALHPWMDEALAQYAVAIYIRARQGIAAYDSALGSFEEQYQFYLTQYPDEVIGSPVVDYPLDSYFYLVYQKGPLFFAALEKAYGYDTLILMLRDYFTAYCYKIAGPDDMLQSFEKTLGEDLTPIFTQWVGAVPAG